MIGEERTGSTEAAAGAEQASAYSHEQTREGATAYERAWSWAVDNPFLFVSLCFGAGVLLNLGRKGSQTTSSRLPGNKTWVLRASLISLGGVLALAGHGLPERIRKSVSAVRAKVRMLLGRPGQEERQTVLVEVYLPQEDIEPGDLNRLLEAVTGFMDRVGFELESEDLPVRGSFFKRFRFQTKKPAAKSEAMDALEAGREALQDATGNKRAKRRIPDELYDAAEELINRLEPFEEAIIAVNEALLILKVTEDGRQVVMVKSMPSAVLKYIGRELQERQPLALYELLSSPAEDTEEFRSKLSERPLAKKARSIYNGATTTLWNIASRIVPSMAEDSTNGTTRSRAGGEEANGRN